MSKFTEKQIALALKQAELDTQVRDGYQRIHVLLCREGRKACITQFDIIIAWYDHTLWSAPLTCRWNVLNDIKSLVTAGPAVWSGFEGDCHDRHVRVR